MINADSIREVQFEKTAVFGYKAEDVDQFLAETAKAFEELTELNEELEEKIAVLAESIEEYREQEDSLKTTLLAAQKLSDTLIKEAKAKAEEIVKAAEKEAAELESSIAAKREAAENGLTRELERESKNLVRMQKEVASFKSNLLDLYKHHLDLITALPDFKDEEDEVEVVEEEEIAEEAGEKALEASEQSSFEEPDEAHIENKSASIFGDISFGEDYSITK